MTNAVVTIWIDNDACPKRVRDIIFKAAERLSLPIKIVANSYMHPPRGLKIEIIVVKGTFDAADDYIVEKVNAGDLVITGDIPLADRIVSKNATALSPRGVLYTEHTVKEALAMRNLHNELRMGGEILGGPKQMDTLDVGRFAAVFDRTITALCKTLNQ